MKNFLYTSFLTLLLAACSGPAPHEETAEHEHSAHEILKANGFKTGSIRQQVIAQSFTVTGRIEAPPQSIARVFPTIGAFVQEVYVIKGREVKKGERLALLRHPDITELQQRYLDAQNRLEQNRQDYLRKQELIKDEAVSTREMQRSKAAYLSSQSEVQGLASVLRSTGIKPESLSSENLQETVVLTAPIAGHILDTRAGVGQYTGTDAPLFTIVSKNHLHLEMQVPPAKIDLVKTGQPVRFTTRTSNQAMRGEVYLVNQVADETGFFNVHAHFSDSLQSMHPGSFAQVQVIYRQDTTAALPLTAVLQQDGQSRALIVENDRLKEVHITTGLASDSLIAVLDPEKLAGKEVVLNGVKYLLAEVEEED